MSENKDNKISVTDSQETYYEKSQNIINNSQMLNESQDFSLIVGDDFDESLKNESQAIPNINVDKIEKDPVERNVVQAETQGSSEESTNCEIGNETQLQYLSQIDETKKDTPVESLSIEDDINDSIYKENRGIDEEDIIQGTPPRISSPSRKLTSGKRKGGSIDEPAVKIQRTLPQTDALRLERERLATRIGKARTNYKLIISNIPGQEKETQSDILCENTENFDINEDLNTRPTQSHPQNVVLAETQDWEDSDPILFGNISDNENKVDKNKSQESREKNKVSSDHPHSQIESANNDPNESKTDDLQLGEKVVTKTSENALEAAINGKDDERITEVDKVGEAMDVTQTEVPEKKICNVRESAKGHRGDKIEKQKPELVKIAEEGEEIVLDFSQEEGDKNFVDSSNEDIQLRFSIGSTNNNHQNVTAFKSCIDSKSNSLSSYKSTAWNNNTSKRPDAIETSDYQLTNANEDITTSGTTKTISSGSDQFIDDLIPDTTKGGASKSAVNDSDADERFNLISKLSDTMDLVNMISENEGDSSRVDDTLQNKSQDEVNTHSNTSADTKTTVYEKKIRFYMELKYLVHVDDNTKDIVCKEVTDVKCEPLIERIRRNSDNSGCFADISGNTNKDTSSGSVISNALSSQPLPLSRFSITSTSSSSSLSSATSLAVKLFKDGHFSLPKGRAKHARRSAIRIISEEKLSNSDNFEKLSQGWKNGRLITDSVLESVNMVINSPEIFQYDTEPGKSEEKLLSSTPELSSSEDKVLSSTPEPVQDESVTSQVATPKSTKNKKPLKRSRTKSNSTSRSDERRKAPEAITTSQEDRVQMHKKKRYNIDVDLSEELSKKGARVSTTSSLRPETPEMEASRILTPQSLPNAELVGKVVFARWSDKNYYPGVVTEKINDKFRVKFYDGESKLLIEEFVIPMPELLREGLSVYATTKEDDYASTGMIVQSEDVDNVIYYTVEMDNGKRVKVRIKDIFLKPGQAEILKEEVDLDSKSLPRTPQYLGKVSLDNLVDGKRRHPVTPILSTPKSRTGNLPRISRTIDPASGSSIPTIQGKSKDISSSESDTKTSGSNVSLIEDVDGVQPELVTIPAMEISKGPSSRMKGRGRSKSKQIQDDTILGPIPPASSKIFQNMSFILTSTSSDIISHHKTDGSCSEAGTENEDEWLRIPFVKERVKAQLIHGGGTVYDSFQSIPRNEYKNTKLITNVPNLTAKSIQCLSVGIPAYYHEWVIQSCRENKALNPCAYELPAGWSLERKRYIEWDNRLNKQPFNSMIVGMPKMDNRNAATRSIQFWRRICENTGAGVQIIDGPETDFSNATVILTDNRCPSWLVEKANSWQIPLVSTVWIVQCIISGRLLVPDSHPQYKHTFIHS